MRAAILLGVTLALPAWGSPSAGEGSIDRAVTQRAEAITRDNQRWQQRQQQQRQAQQQRLAGAEAELARARRQLADLKRQVGQAEQQKQALQQQLTDTTFDLELLQSSFHSSLKSLAELWRQAPSQSLWPQRQQWLEQRLGSSELVTLAQLQRLVDYAMADLEQGRKVTDTQVQAALASGRVATVAARVVGHLQAASPGAEQLPGWLVYGDPASPLPDLKEPASSELQARLARWLESGAAPLPVDLSGGHLLAKVDQGDSAVQWFGRGGPLLWPMALLFACGLLVALWRGWVLGRERMMASLLTLSPAERQQPEQLRHFLRRQPGELARRFAGVVEEPGADAPGVLEGRLKQLMLARLAHYERGLGLIALLAAMAPMLGLLGTVSGMIETFAALTEYGNRDPKLLSEGISKALITTQAGLMVAVPLMLLHYPLKRRVQRLTGMMEEQGALLLALWPTRESAAAEPEGR